MSYTKTLVPRSPSGINTLGEYDVFYALQTSVADFYPKTTTLKPAVQEYEDGDEEDSDDGDTDAGNNGQVGANGVPNTGSMNTNDGVAAMNGSNLGDIPGLPNLIISDPNYNVGKHPGEIYVFNNTQLPRRRYEYINFGDNKVRDWQQWDSVRDYQMSK